MDRVGAARGCTLSLFDLCSRTNKDRRWETMTGVETWEVFAGRRMERRRGRSNARILFSFLNSQLLQRPPHGLYTRTSARARTHASYSLAHDPHALATPTTRSNAPHTASPNRSATIAPHGSPTTCSYKHTPGAHAHAHPSCHTHTHTRAPTRHGRHGPRPGARTPVTTMAMMAYC